MNILLVTQNFSPENFKSNDLAFELQKRGYNVTVLTSIPNYPQGKFYKGNGIFSKRKEVINGVKVLRTLVIPRGNGGGVMLALNYLSWAFIASVWAFFMALFHKYDLVLVHETSPITQGFPALVVKLIRRCPIFFWVLDLWPESLQAAGGINNKYVLGFFTWVTRLMYSNSQKILVSSKGFKNSILDKGDFEHKIVYFPNWAEDVFDNPPVLTEDQQAVVNKLPDGFKVMFTGNLGEAQDFDHVLEAAKLLKENKRIKFILIGDGRKRAWITEFIDQNGLSDTVFWMGRYPIELMPAFCKCADVLFLSLKDDFIFSLTAPAKLQSYMAMKKPILAMINGETQNIIKEAGCGLSVNAGDYKSFADNVLRLSVSPDLEQFGIAGYEYYTENFSKSKCFDKLEVLIKSI